MAQPYCELRTLHHQDGRTGLTIGSQPLSAAQEAWLRLGLAPQEPAAALDALLLRHSQQHGDGAALLCLRCRLSWPLEQKLRDLWQRNKELYELDLLEMASLVLDDNGALELRLVGPGPDGRTVVRRQPYTWEWLSQSTERCLRPFSAEVLRSYNPERSGLPHWARQQVLAHGELKAYFREHGLLLIGDWALLGSKTSQKRLRQAWARCGEGSLPLEAALTLHHSFLEHYGAAKDLHRRRTGKQNNWEPDDAFLLQLRPDQPSPQTLDQLRALARAVRRYVAGADHRRAFAEGEEAAIADPSSGYPGDGEEGGWSGPALQAQITGALERAVGPHAAAALRRDQPKWAKDPSRRLAWELYGQGAGQRTIAEQCEHQQAWVSKLLNEKQLAGAIALAAATELARHPAFAEVSRRVEGAERLVEALRNHLVNPEQEGSIAPLRLAIARALSSLDS